MILGPCCLRVSLKTDLNSWRCLCLSFGLWCAWWDNTPKYRHIGFQHLNGVILLSNCWWYVIMSYGCKFLEGFIMFCGELVEILMFGFDYLILINCSFSTYSYNFCILYSVGVKNMEVFVGQSQLMQNIFENLKRNNTDINDRTKRSSAVNKNMNE